jgi:transposase
MEGRSAALSQVWPGNWASTPKLLYRRPPAQFAAEVGTKAVTRDLDVRALRARLKRAEQKLKILKKPW